MYSKEHVSKPELVIAYGRTKRRLSIPFDICGGREDLLLIANAILAKCEENFCFGWVSIDLPLPRHVTDIPVDWD